MPENIKPNHSKIVLAYVKSRENHFVFITLALYDLSNDRWIDMMRDKNSEIELNVIYWIDINDPPIPYKWYTSLGMHHYRTIYLNNIFKPNSSVDSSSS